MLHLVPIPLKRFTLAVGGAFKRGTSTPHILAAAPARCTSRSTTTSTSPARVNVTIAFGLGGHLASSCLEKLHISGLEFHITNCKRFPMTAMSMYTMSVDGFSVCGDVSGKNLVAGEGDESENNGGGETHD